MDVQDSDEDITSEEDSSFSSESSTTDDDLPADQDENDEETVHINDINVGDFAVVKYDYSLYSFSLSKFMLCYSNIEKKKLQKWIWLSIFSLPSTTRQGGKLDFISSKEMINSLRFLY